MKHTALIILGIILALLVSSCSKQENDYTTGGENATLAFQLDLFEETGLKSDVIENWEHPLDVISIALTNLDNGARIVEEFASQDALIMTVPKGKYNVSISTVDQDFVSNFLQFSKEIEINASYSMNIPVQTEKKQCLLTVSNSKLIPTVNDVEIFFKSGIYYAYITGWDGKWQIGEKTISTSMEPVPGKMYNFVIKEDGSIEEGVEEWDNDFESILDRLVESEFNNIANQNGFLIDQNPEAQAVWKKRRGDNEASAEISSIVSHLLYLSGYKEVSKLGYNANLNYLNEGNDLSGTSLYGLLGGYEATRKNEYKALAQRILPQVKKDFSPGGTHAPRLEYWGYDYINYLESANKAVKHGLDGALEYYELLMQDYLANYERMAKNDYHRLYVNAIYDRLGIGSYQGPVDWDHAYSLQDAAAGLMGNSWENETNIKKHIINNLLQDAASSEDLAEAIYALSL